MSVLDKVYQCQPQPAEVLVHIDKADGTLHIELGKRFPAVNIVTSARRLGPGGGRHRCLLACRMPYAVGFDDDFYPVDPDFFARIEPLFERFPRAAIFGASIWHRHEVEKLKSEFVVPSASYMGCGYAIRIAAYRQVRGTLPRPVPYGMEETDLSLQLYTTGWDVYEARELRVLHDTDLKHHVSGEVTAGIIANVGLFVFLHYPVRHWGWGFLQVTNRVIYSIRMGRLQGILAGIIQIPIDCYRNRLHRKPVPLPTLKRFLELRRAAN